ncbi:MAG: hypothetical protein JWN85_4784 [Gammaproteobacteria bacterium]|nr:hypothetical protein [Gammaproteobacteria bacterium]
MRGIVTLNAKPTPLVRVAIGVSQRAVSAVGFSFVAVAASVGMLGPASADTAKLRYSEMAPISFLTPWSTDQSAGGFGVGYFSRSAASAPLGASVSIYFAHANRGL